MTQKLIYELDKVLKINVNSSKMEQKTKRFLEVKNLIEHYYKLNNLQGAYDLAISLMKNNPNDASIYLVLGDISKKSTNHLEAIRYYKKSYTINITCKRVNSKLYNYLMTTKPSVFLDEWSEGFELLLTNKKILGHKKLYLIANEALRYLMLNTNFKKLIQFSNENFLDPDKLKLKDIKVIDSIKEKIEILSNSQLFLLSIEEAVIYELEIEKLLTFLRKFILLNIKDFEFIEKIYNLIESMALNCFFNDYIFYLSKEEIVKLKELEKKICLVKNQTLPITNSYLLCLAMYKNLLDFSLNNKITISGLPFKFSKHCILNPLTEKNIIKEIKIFGDISDNVSIKVKRQYELYPYPLWSYTDTYLQKKNITEYLYSLGLRFPNNQFFLKDINSMLIAGCGTGKEAAENAEFLSNMNITAIDLSKVSLGYAIRKCQEMEIHNVNFLHGDILNLDKINRKFDIVSSNGVVHHMKDPTAGCAALLGRLKKNGLIKLSLYSETARREILEFQDDAKLQNLQSRESLINFRNKIIRNNNIEANWMTTVSDFYNLSDFKDLICHEQEHTFTIKKIKILIKHFKLEFCGFQNIDELHTTFVEYYNSSQNLYNLDYWEEFEEKNPNIFKSMYQFWCQKNY